MNVKFQMAGGLSRYCRLCAEENDNKTNILLDDSGKLSDIIYKFLFIKINMEDCLPLNICGTCRLTVVSFEEFALKCNNAQIVLESLLRHENFLDESLIKSETSGCEENTLQDIKTEAASSNDDSDFCNDDILPIAKYIKKKKENDPDYEMKPSKMQQKKKVNNSEIINSRTYSKLPKNQDNPNKKPKTDYTFFKYICHICSEQFRRLNHLENHTKEAHSVAFKLLCVCETYLSSRSSVIRHIKKHTSKTDYSCKHCDLLFSTKKALRDHVKQLPKQYYPFSCNQCPKKFLNAWKLKMHEKSHIPFEVRCIHHCDDCGSKFTSKSLLRIHIEVDHNRIVPFVCDICGRSLRTRGQLTSHRNSHNDKELFSCTMCPKRFKTKYRVKRHMDSHSHISYKCPKCPDILNTKATLRNHMRGVHEDIRNYVCAFCNKAFKRKKALNCHMNRHTGYQPYVCPWCPKTFVDNSNLRGHKKSMHAVQLKEYEAVHGPPINAVTRKPSSKDSEVIEYTPNLKTPKTIVFPKLDVEPSLVEFIHN